MKISDIESIVSRVVATQADKPGTGAEKKRRAIDRVIRSIDAAVQWPGPVGRLIDLVDGPLAIWIGHLVEDAYRRHKARAPKPERQPGPSSKRGKG